jgi:hypothetical protein
LHELHAIEGLTPAVALRSTRSYVV